MLSAAKHLSAGRARPFAALRVTLLGKLDECLLGYLIGAYTRAFRSLHSINERNHHRASAF